MKTLALALSLSLGLAAASADAQLIYRCGTRYSQVPCPDGKVLDSSDPRSAAQRAAARTVVANERKQANQMERDRLAQEAATKPALAGSLTAAKPPAAAASAAKKSTKKKRKAKPNEAKDFVAVVPGTAKNSGHGPAP